MKWRKKREGDSGKEGNVIQSIEEEERKKISS
jgi:hypothetical protein